MTPFGQEKPPQKKWPRVRKPDVFALNYEPVEEHAHDEQ